jgi:CRP/FNR family transcriptional regulator, anaerobic regulatory protein
VTALLDVKAQNMTSHDIRLVAPADHADGVTRRIPLVPLPGHGSLDELLALLGQPRGAAPAPSAALPLPVWRLAQDGVLLREGSAGQTLYVVRSGSLKCQKTLEDGYEQVLSLALAGDLIGSESLHGARRPYSAVALEDCTVYALATNELHDLAQRAPALDDALRAGLSRQLARAADIAEMMAAVSSDVRLARFLLRLSARMADVGQSPRRLRLRLGRRDIASLLGVAHETVSRSFSTLAEAGILRVANREVELLDLEALHARARTTRGVHGDAPPAATRTGRPAVRSSWWSALDTAAAA